MLEGLIISAVLGTLALLLIAPTVLVIILWTGQRRLARRLERLEKGDAADPGRAASRERRATAPSPQPAGDRDAESAASPAARSTAPSAADRRAPGPVQRAFDRLADLDWENFLGRHALGWAAVLLLVIGVAFFLKYAFENRWIGPLGRVALGVFAGVGLIAAGFSAQRRSWRFFSRVLSAAGTVLLYLSVFAAFGFYSLLGRDAGGAFLFLVVVEACALAAFYNSWVLGFTGIVGGLLVPLLLQSEQDRFAEQFVYLLVLDAGALSLLLWRRWTAVATLALAGTQGLYWFWHANHYHPEKFGWALGFQLTLFVLFVVFELLSLLRRRGPPLRETLVRMPLNAGLFFLALYVLLAREHADWRGACAVAMAALYAVFARGVFSVRPGARRTVFVALAITVAFVAVAVPIQAKADWIALGWAAECAALYFFGLWGRSSALRALSVPLFVVSAFWLVFVQTPWHTREPFAPLINDYGTPAVVTVALLLGTVVSGLRPLRRELSGTLERYSLLAAGLVSLALLWVVLSVETYAYFDAYAALPEFDTTRWRWMGQLALSALWALYASALLFLGFSRGLASLRWTALGLFALTIIKVAVYDTADLRELYRVLALILVAVIAGLAAWAYERARRHLDRKKEETT